MAAARVIGQLVRSGADGLGRVVELRRFRRRPHGFAPARLVDDVAAAVGRGRQHAEGREAVRQQRQRLARLDHQRQRVGRVDGVDAAGEHGEGGGGVLDRRNPAQRIDHVPGREISAVREPDVRAQLEFPRPIVDRPPRGGEARDELLLLVIGDEPLEDVLPEGVVGAEIMEMRIDRRHLGGHPDLELLRHAGDSRSESQQVNPEQRTISSRASSWCSKRPDRAQTPFKPNRADKQGLDRLSRADAIASRGVPGADEWMRAGSWISCRGWCGSTRRAATPTSSWSTGSRTI